MSVNHPPNPNTVITSPNVHGHDSDPTETFARVSINRQTTSASAADTTTKRAITTDRKSMAGEVTSLADSQSFGNLVTCASLPHTLRRWLHAA